jgi:hypothetical protein
MAGRFARQLHLRRISARMGVRPNAARERLPNNHEGVGNFPRTLQRTTPGKPSVLLAAASNALLVRGNVVAHGISITRA